MTRAALWRMVQAGGRAGLLAKLCSMPSQADLLRCTPCVDVGLAWGGEGKGREEGARMLPACAAHLARWPWPRSRG